MAEIRYVWELPVRIIHWANALSIVVLALTGFYIGHPFLSAGEGVWIMGWMRFIHFVFAYVFTLALLSRLVWFFMGNKYSSWRMYKPWFTKRGRASAMKFLRYYTFTGKKIPYEIGHNPLACLVYLVIFAMFAVQIATGFALYGLAEPGGFWYTLTAPLTALVELQWIRLIHHAIEWLVIGFIINHIYSAWLMDVKEMNGTMSSIFSGYKFIEREDLPYEVE